jgi:hypothetical protein
MTEPDLITVVANFRTRITSVHAAGLERLTHQERVQLLFETRWCIEALRDLQSRLAVQEAVGTGP